jgi:hypothetical protein
VAADRTGRKHDAYVQRARAARVEQGLPEVIEDPATLDFLADVLGSAPHRRATSSPGDEPAADGSA